MIPDYADAIAAFAVPRDDEGLDLHAMLSQLGQRDINEVQVEAGPTLSGALFRDGLVDELLLYVAPVLLGDKGRPLLGGLGIHLMTDRLGLKLIEQRQVGPDLRLLLRPER
jgi:diaminohydroxyphosphoribosylaminopyrimidine deaminase/5-amino-6-(5-phosphoribosylamino)uracil reductase